VTPNRNYTKGVRYERILQKYLYSVGYDVVTRSAGSHGPIDIVAQNVGHVLNVQVKCGDASDDDENLQEFWRLAEEDLLTKDRGWQLWHHIKGSIWKVTEKRWTNKGYYFHTFEFRMPSMSKSRRKKIAD
jgi:Holliday junction resolvase-like predicted endonuclease